MKPAELHALAKSLKLTERQRKFAEAYAADPTSNGAAAAKAAGYGAGAKVRAAELVTHRNVQQYVAAIVGSAPLDATAAAVERVSLWRKFADGLVTKTQALVDSTKLEEIDARVVSNGVKAAALLQKSEQAQKEQPASVVNLALVIGAMPDSAKVQIYHAFLGNGNQ